MIRFSSSRQIELEKCVLIDAYAHLFSNIFTFNERINKCLNTLFFSEANNNLDSFYIWMFIFGLSCKSCDGERSSHLDTAFSFTISSSGNVDVTL